MSALDDAGRVAVGAAYADAVRSGDVERQEALCEPDAVVWHNTDEVENDLETTSRIVRWLHRSMPDVEWTDRSILATSTGFIWQSIMTGTTRSGPVRAHTCLVVTLSDRGLIQRVDEYFDPAKLAPISA